MRSLKFIWLSFVLLTTTLWAKTPHEAARHGDLETLRQFRFEGTDLFKPNARGFIPYELAALHADPAKALTMKRHVEVMLWLKEYRPEKHQYGKAANALVQAGLNALGYAAGSADGIMGRQTSRAIRDYQRDNGLAETGRLGPQWLGTLHQDILKDLQFKLKELGYNIRHSDGIVGLKTQTAMAQFRQKHSLPVPEYPYLDSDIIMTASRLYNVKEQQRKADIAKKDRQKNQQLNRYLQAGLRAMGYPIGKVDGYSGSKTVNALKAFQKKNGLSTSGELDDKTMTRLEKAFVKNTQSQLNLLGYEVGQPDGVMGQRTQRAINTFTQKQGLKKTDGINTELLIRLHDSVVRTNDARQPKRASATLIKEADQVRFAQAGLRTLGYPISVDGIMGKTTAGHIKTFQKRYRLKRTGTVDSPTFAKMQTIFLKESQRKLNALGFKAGKPDGQMGSRTKTAIRQFCQQSRITNNGLSASLIVAIDDAYDARPPTIKRNRPQAVANKGTPKQKAPPASAQSSVKKTIANVGKTPAKAKPAKAMQKPAYTKQPSGGRSAKGRMRFNRNSGRVVGCSIAGRNIPIEWCEPFYPLPKNNHCEATFKPSSDSVINLWCK